jgi:hypothetical protein
MDVGFPVITVERGDMGAFDRCRIKAIDIDAVAVGVRAGHIKGFDAAGLAEEMLGGAGIESISR